MILPCTDLEKVEADDEDAEVWDEIEEEQQSQNFEDECLGTDELMDG